MDASADHTLGMA